MHVEDEARRDSLSLLLFRFSSLVGKDKIMPLYSSFFGKDKVMLLYTTSTE